jgi:DNA-directed RNA polymerase specialized sigma24 family protein
MGSRWQRHTDLEDICQEIFIRGIKAIHSLAPDSGYRDFEALMLQHASWQVVDSARAVGRFEGESNVPGELMTIPIDLDIDRGSVLLSNEKMCSGYIR